MKKVFNLVFLLIICLQLFSQDVGKFDKEYYLDKSKSQKTAGYTLVGVGVGFVVLGGIVWASGFTEDFSNAFAGSNTSSGDTEMDAGNILAIIGAAAALSSIPLFIAAGKNKRRL